MSNRHNPPANADDLPEGPWQLSKNYPVLPEPLETPIIDNHTHLNLAVTDDLTVEMQLDYAEQVGVTRVMQIGTDIESSAWSVALAEKDARVLAAVAIHPNEAPRVAERGQLAKHLDRIAELAEHPRVRVIGETGLDFFRTEGDEAIRQQFASFEAHIDMARQLNLALQIHDREAHRDVLKTLDRVGSPERTVLHCFSGDRDFAEECVRRGYYFSYAGTVTFGNADNLRQALEVIPLELLVLETDAPYLTPAPFRGRHNSAYLLPHTFRYIADFLGVSEEKLALQTNTNCELLYGSWSEGVTVND
ncbi:MAG: TatD family hydrolase [Microbacteriaceae bacterium]